jgi:basic amino acid/polyamine antiporter, APA family
VKKNKKIGFLILTSLVVGNMVGSGAYLLPSALAELGTITIFSWIFTAIGAILLALVFSRLSQLFPKTGGPYIYCKEAYGEFVAFQVAYNYWIYMWVGNAAIALAFTGYLSAFWPEVAHNNILAFSVTVGLVWLLTLVNAISLRSGGILQFVTSAIKLLPLLFIIVVGFFYTDTANWKEFNLTGKSNFSAVSSGAILTLWAFLGMESACIPADDVVNPKKTIPRATIVGTLIAAAIYILSMAAITGIISPSELAKSASPFGDAAGKLFGPWGKWFVSAGAVVACLGTLNGWILLQGQVPYAAAKDGLFPKSFAYKSKQGIPLFGLIISSILVTILLAMNFNKNLVDKFTFIISLAALAALITYLFSTMAQVILLVNKGESLKKAAKSITVAILACIYTFWAIIGSGQEIVFYGAILLFTSVPIYARMVWYKKTRKTVRINK